MQADISWNARRVAVLHDLLARWIAELPAIKAVDAERAHAHEQGIADLRRMIEGIEAEHGANLIPAVITVCNVRHTRLEMSRHDRQPWRGRRERGGSHSSAFPLHKVTPDRQRSDGSVRRVLKRTNYAIAKATPLSLPDTGRRRPATQWHRAPGRSRRLSRRHSPPLASQLLSSSTSRSS